MKRTLLLSALALTLAACGGTSKPVPLTDIRVTGTYTYAVSARQTVVTVRPGKLGTRFCYTDSSLSGPQVCHNLDAGQIAVTTGYAFGVVFTEPDATASPALTRP